MAIQSKVATIDELKLRNEIRSDMPPQSELSFSVLRQAFCADWDINDTSVNIRSTLLKYFLEEHASRIHVDEVWYREKYSDISRAIDEGKFQNAKHHYAMFGYIEDRIPHAIKVDDHYYTANNKDIADGIRVGRIVSCQDHFEQYGFKEGRLPYRNWRLIENV